MNVMNRLTTVKLIASRSGGVSTKIMLHEVNVPLEQLAQIIQMSTASGFDAADLPSDYPGGISFNYGIEADTKRVFCFVEPNNTPLALGHGVTQGGFSDANAVHIAISTGQTAGGDIFTPAMIDFIAKTIADIFYDFLEFSSSVSLTTNLLRRTGQLANLDMSAVKDATDYYLIVRSNPESVSVDLFASATTDLPVGANVANLDDVDTIIGDGATDWVLGKPNVWLKVPWAGSYVLVPGYYID